MISTAVNPITVEVVRNGLAHIANEMATVLRKTSYNMMIYEVRDYCVGIVDPDGNILSQNFGALPIFLADLGPGDRRRRAHARPGRLSAGRRADHESSLCLRPASEQRRGLHAVLSSTASWWRFSPCARIGSISAADRMGFGFSGTREVYEEGLQFRSLKLYRGEQPNQDLFQIITDNVRFAESSLGDLRAQIAACRVGDRGLGALVSRYGLERFSAVRESDLAAVRGSGAGTSCAHQTGQIRSRSVVR